MEATSVYKFKSKNELLLNNIYHSIFPELDMKISDKSTVKLFFERTDILVLYIESKNITSLRATTNTWLRLIKVAFDVQSIENINENN